MQGFIGVLGKASTKASTILALAHYPTRARRGHAHCTDARKDQSSYPYKMKVQDMTQRYRKFKRAWGMWYAFGHGHGQFGQPQNAGANGGSPKSQRHERNRTATGYQPRS